MSRDALDLSFSNPLSPKVKCFLISAVAVSSTMWDLSFNLGAFGVVFFGHFFTAWAMVSAIFLGCCLLPQRQSPVNQWGLMVMAFPTIGFFFSFLNQSHTNVFLSFLSIVAAIITYVFCLPYAIYVIFSITEENLVRLPKKLVVKLIAIALFIGGVGFYVGDHNNLFLSCFDFKVSGNDLPTNCRSEDAMGDRNVLTSAAPTSPDFSASIKAN